MQLFFKINCLDRLIEPIYNCYHSSTHNLEGLPMRSDLSKPVYVQIELTSQCNNNCIYCYNFWKYRDERLRARPTLSTKQWTQVAQTLGKLGIFYVTITGGEPLLEKEKLFSISRHLQKQGIRLMLNTNGTLVDEATAQGLRDLQFETALVSLLSSNAETHDKLSHRAGAFHETIKGIEALLKQGIHVAINSVATKLNHQGTFTTGEWLFHNFGIKNFNATPICPSAHGHQSLKLSPEEIITTLSQLMRLRKEYGTNVDILEVLPTCLFADNLDEESIAMFSRRMCTAGNTTITIGSMGDVRACSYDDKIEGNILKDNFAIIWERMKKWRDDTLLPKECHNCKIVGECGGGCRVNSSDSESAMSRCNMTPLLSKKYLIALSHALKQIPMDQSFSIRHGIMLRQETSTLYLVTLSPMSFIIIDINGLRLLRYLAELPYFTPFEIIDTLNLGKSRTTMFFNELFNKGFLQQSGANQKQ